MLSGFLITSQLLRSLLNSGRISLLNFYLRRGFRIWPNYLAALIIYFFIPLFIERSSLPPLWKFLTFTQNFGLDIREGGAFSHAWSLCVEEQFYLLLPILLIFTYRRLNTSAAIALVIAVFSLGAALRYGLWIKYIERPFTVDSSNGFMIAYFKQIYYPTYCRLDGLTIGVSIALLQHLRPSFWRKLTEHSNKILLIGIFLLIDSGIIFIDRYSLVSTTFGFLLVNLGFGFLVIAAVSQKGLFSKVRIAGVELAATLVFAFYMTHKQLIHLSNDWLTQAGYNPVSVVFPITIISTCLIAASILYYVVERPFLKLRETMLKRDG